MLQGWVLHSYSYANDPVHKFAGVRMVNGGYIGLEAMKLKDELKEIIHLNNK